MYKIILFSFITLFHFTEINSQNNADRERAISTIESITYGVDPFGGYHKIVFQYFDKDDRMEISNIIYMDKKLNSKVTYSLYMEDLDKNSMVYDYFEVDSKLYAAQIIIKSKTLSIEKITKSMNHKKLPFPEIKSEFCDEIRIVVIKSLPLSHIEKLIKSIEVALKITNSKYVNFIE